MRDVVGGHDPAAADSPDRVLRHAWAPSHADLYLTQRRLHEYLRRAPAPDLLFVEESAVTLFAGTMANLYARNTGSHARRDGLTRRNRDTVEAVCAYLNRTFTENRSLGTIARLERLADVPDLLTIALDLGYSVHSHFTAAFRRHFGDVPSRLRALA